MRIGRCRGKRRQLYIDTRTHYSKGPDLMTGFLILSAAITLDGTLEYQPSRVDGRNRIGSDKRANKTQ